MNIGPKYIPTQKQTTQQQQEQKLKEASKMYERHFLNEMVKQMRKTVPKSDLVPESYAEKIYKSKMDEEYVDTWNQQGGIGLADLIYKQMHEKIFPNQNINAPSGPIDIDKNTKGQVHPLKKQKGAAIQFQQEFKGGESVVMPWSGQKIGEMNIEGRNIIHLKHDNGLKSTLSFYGNLHSKQNHQQIDAGLKLGEMSPGTRGLTWVVKS